MKKILYIHGLGSGKNSMTSVTLEEIFKGEFEVLHPQIPQDPFEAEAFLCEYVKKEDPDLLIASSQGGFYALAFFPERKKIVYNPALEIPAVVEDVIGFGTYEYTVERDDGAKEYTLDREYVDKLKVIQKRLHENINEKTKESTYAVICDDDELLGLNTPEEFRRLFGEEHLLITSGGHKSTDENLRVHIAGLARKLLLSNSCRRVL